jgi:aminopeptidase-like protein
LIDFAESKLRIAGYSGGLIRTRIPPVALRDCVHALSDQPDLVSYCTVSHKEEWGFCHSHDTLESLLVDPTLADGSLTYTEHVVAEEGSDGVLVARRVCHPGSANPLVGEVTSNKHNSGAPPLRWRPQPGADSQVRGDVVRGDLGWGRRSTRRLTVEGVSV